MFYLFCLLFALALTFSFGLLLLFLLAAKKKKVTKRKTAVCSFGPAAKLRSSEAQELASLKQPALLFAVLCFSAFRSETEDGIFCAGCRSSPLAKSLWGVFASFVFALGLPLGAKSLCYFVLFVVPLSVILCGKVGISLPVKVSWSL
ncbi:hypothetical protein [Phocaeicola plebeius]|uniref:hypothetical protein n=1 Tax=Phocaeicola plebeius TaxID=310297 RepID=UPI00189C0D3E|nr:hypothetical protein [Phocaeicola plebeius]